MVSEKTYCDGVVETRGRTKGCEYLIAVRLVDAGQTLSEASRPCDNPLCSKHGVGITDFYPCTEHALHASAVHALRGIPDPVNPMSFGDRIGIPRGTAHGFHVSPVDCVGYTAA